MYLLTYLQTTYHLSRRTIVDFIKQGKILVNQHPIQSFKHIVSPGDEITFPDGNTVIVLLEQENPKQPQYAPKLILFNKPKGYVVSKSDPYNTTIYELLPPTFQTYYYIGRLDKESRGLLLLTNTPKLVHQYEHPRFAITKEYLIQLSSPLSSADQQQAKNGIRDEGELLTFKAITPTSLPNQYHVKLNEGKKRHIRRVIKALGYELLDLQRIKEGKRQLGDLKEGEWKEVS